MIQGLKGLEILGVKMREHPTQMEIMKDIIKARWNLWRGKIKTFVNYKRLNDKELMA